MVGMVTHGVYGISGTFLKFPGCLTGLHVLHSNSDNLYTNV